MKCITIFVISLVAIVVTFIIITSVVLDEPSKYCNLASCGNSRHPMCNYKPRTNPNCETCSFGILKDHKVQLLKFHNDLFRSNKINEDVPPLIWNDELATIAQRWANQTPYSNDQCRDTPTMRVGQHISYILHWDDLNTPGTLLFQNIWDIYNHTVGYIDSLIANVGVFKPRGKLIRKLLFDDAKYLGCGFVSCDIRRRQHYLTKTHLVCNYGPYDPK